MKKNRDATVIYTVHTVPSPRQNSAPIPFEDFVAAPEINGFRRRSGPAL